MNVCLLNDSFPPVIDGVVNVVMNYANYLHQDHGCEVVVGTPYYPDADYSAYPYRVVPYRSYNTTALAMILLKRKLSPSLLPSPRM